MESSRTIPFFLLLLLFRITTLVTAGEDDAEILLAFKSAVANSSVVLRGWVSGKDPCSFSGVTCNTSSRVSAVNLDGLPLAVDLGHVASTLMGMESLESLSLAAANVSGDLSKVAEAAACGRNLVEVDLSGNVISGSVSSVSLLSTSCRGLVRLNLSGNSVSFPGRKLPLSPQLQMLDLSDNKLVGDGLLSWLLSSGNGCGGMRVLRLKNNLVSGRIPVAECSFLQHLDLSYNNFSGEMPDLGECSTLQHLDLSSNWFSGEIGSGLSSCHSLKLLNLSSNAFSGTIPSNLNGGSLQFISLAVNQLEGVIPPQLFRPCTALLELDLSENSLSGDLPDSLSGCKMLESISLSNNNFTGEIPSATLSALSHLKKLVLSFNYYSGKLSSDLFVNFNQLEVFGLSSNNIEGPIPADICRGNPRLSSLKELYLQNNYFVGSIPPSLSNCSGLVSLDLSFNFLTGNIPSSLGSLSQLRDLLMWLNQLDGPIPPELSNIRNLENLILDNNGLSGSLPQELSLCSQLNWLSVSSNFLTGPIPTWLGGLSNLAILQLRNNSFTGLVPPELGNCKSLIWLDLSNNNLTGTIPGALAKQSGNIAVGLVGGKRYAYLRGDGSPGCRGAGNLIEFAGIRPEQLDRLPISHSCNLTRVYLGNTKYTFKNNGSMIFLDLSYNSLTGTIPPELGPMYYLMILNLGHNDLSGEIPPSLGQLKFIGILDLSHNHFEGQIPPSFSSMAMLAEIDVSNNNLSGPIPEQGQLATFPAFRYANNSGLCGLPLPPCGGGGASFNSASRDHQKSDKRATSLAGSIAIGLLFFVFCIVGLVIIYIENRRKRKKKRDAVDVFGDEQQSNATGWKFLPTKELLTMSISMATFDKPLQKLTLGDLLEATNNFHQDSLVGSGGFGDVYKAELKEGTVVAVKKLIHVSGQGDREFTAEMETIGKIKHRNLVPLLGYCKVGEERLLVYEYMKYGSLDDVLHDQKKGSVALDWEARRKIAVGAARGLAFLHHNCIPHIIHRDMKSSNVLLDDNLEARVSDFGMARLMSAMDTHLSVSTLAGTPGYVPPEYYQSFRCSTKGDVYSYGVVLLELLTGRQPTDSTDFGDNNLVGWVKQHAKLRISDVFDPALNVKDHPGLEMELLQHLKIACQCLDDRPWKRPTMLQVMAMFKELQSICVSSKDSNESILPSIGSLDNVSCLKE